MLRRLAARFPSAEEKKAAELAHAQSFWADVAARAADSGSSTLNDFRFQALHRKRQLASSGALLVNCLWRLAASTLFQYGQHFARFLWWCWRGDVPPFPPSPFTYAEFLLELVDGGCGKDVPRNFRAAFWFVSDRLYGDSRNAADHPLVRGILDLHKRANGAPIKRHRHIHRTAFVKWRPPCSRGLCRRLVCAGS